MCHCLVKLKRKIKDMGSVCTQTKGIFGRIFDDGRSRSELFSYMDVVEQLYIGDMYVFLYASISMGWDGRTAWVTGALANVMIQKRELLYTIIQFLYNIALDSCLINDVLCFIRLFWIGALAGSLSEESSQVLVSSDKEVVFSSLFVSLLAGLWKNHWSDF